MENDSQSIFSTSDSDSESSDVSETPTSSRKRSQKSEDRKQSPKKIVKRTTTKKSTGDEDGARRRTSKRSRDVASFDDMAEEVSSTSKPRTVKKRKHEPVSTKVRTDFSEKSPQTVEIPGYDAFLGDQWYVRITTYKGRQYICLRHYEDKNLTKSLKGIILMEYDNPQEKSIS